MKTKSGPVFEPALDRFIRGQGELTLCVSADHHPYCASCFYSFLQEEGLLVIKSEEKTRHIREALINSKVAGTIVERVRMPGVIKGLQFTGDLFSPPDGIIEKVKRNYYQRYPFASVMKGSFWVIEPHWIKMTDNTPVTGKKILWERIKL